MAAIFAENDKPLAVRNKMRKRKIKEETVFGYLFLLPTLGAFILFSLIPTVAVFALSFFSWDLIRAPIFLGFQNYTQIFTSHDFWHGLWVTIQYVFYSQTPKLIIALLLAICLNRSLPGIKAFRIPIILPWIAMPIAVATVWRWIMDPMTGLLNYYLKLIGLPGITFFTPGNTLQSIALIDVWQHFGFATILFLVGLQSIPSMYYEAAELDGAVRWKAFRHITLPLLKPTILFLLITSIIGSFQVFDIVYATTHGGPGDVSRVYYYLIYEKAFNSLQMGYASGLCVILFILLMLLTIVQLRLFREKDTY
ncbi:carbohydrate ABC transporter permease [Paenibacillus thalictri]|uniref:Sugar ABC transporter permease n=1 Tax=Paenibacillus thalictri TaxID=2527873 RepID=A0A4Q9DUI7_9BACL|nr:sugar ABC transporter permease [Paenibacillus thalictri]TBL79078.1 sugar ABC transporter permease [Paenibacillus thalictri]